ncbi:MAG: hypothetical protein GF398_04445 [Chitinivibrionales bacterium]|nr:hypothetical protein [Chitinivibrionales bacterium]
MLIWPDKVAQPRATDIPACTSDFYPTILDYLGYSQSWGPRPIDGISLKSLIDGSMQQRPVPIAVEHYHGGKSSNRQIALIDNQYKLVQDQVGGAWKLYDLRAGSLESDNVAAQHPDVVAAMKAMLQQWEQSCDNSLNGNDYTATRSHPPRYYYKRTEPSKRLYVREFTLRGQAVQGSRAANSVRVKPGAKRVKIR